MNQILNPEVNNLNTKSNKKIYKLQFVFSLIIATILLIISLIRIFNMKKDENLSKQLATQYKISTLYSENSNYSAQTMNDSFTLSQTPFVIGMIKIDKINLNYPILSESNKEHLRISLCRFAGPMPNQIRKSLYCWT